MQTYIAKIKNHFGFLFPKSLLYFFLIHDTLSHLMIFTEHLFHKFNEQTVQLSSNNVPAKSPVAAEAPK